MLKTGFEVQIISDVNVNLIRKAYIGSYKKTKNLRYIFRLTLSARPGTHYYALLLCIIIFSRRVR